MADSDLINSGVEDAESLPECFILSEPLQDPYESDMSMEHQQKEGTDEQGPLNSTQVDPTKYSCDLPISFMVNKTRACYGTEGKNVDFMNNDDLTLEECLEVMLDFSLKDTGRISFTSEVKTYDGLTVNEIISLWQRVIPCLRWVVENFNVTLKDNVGSQSMENLVMLMMGEKEQPQYDLMSEEQAQHKYTVVRRCIRFVWEFFAIMDELEKSNSCSDKYKEIVSLFANLIDVKYRNNGDCKLETEISDPNSSNLDPVNVISIPDLLFLSDSEDKAVPVEIYVPETPKTKPNRGEDEATERKFKTQHLLQHIGLISKQILNSPNWEHNCTDPKHLNEQRVSVGLFIEKNTVYFSKAISTPCHLSSFIRDLLPKYFSNNDRLAKYLMKSRSVENGIKEIRSNWSLDLYTGVHRNALLIFLVHYMHGSKCAIMK